MCKDFIAEQMGGIYRIETKAFDIYEKNGRIVAEVGYRNSGTDGSYSVRLCVVDKERETISLPSPLNDGHWRK